MGNQEGEVEWCSGDPPLLVRAAARLALGVGAKIYSFEVPTHNFGQSRCCG
jgi:hypothetical protein